MQIPILIIAYNRDKSLIRLLKSLNYAEYDRKNIELIISIDKTDNKKVYQIADDFEWRYGRKTIIKHKKRLGLKKHVLVSGDISQKFDALIMLEDDLIVSKYFYRYSQEAVKYYLKDQNIAGISLYNYSISEFAEQRTFIPMQDDSDVFFMKVPSSWGQLWTREQWAFFRNWYNNAKYKKCNYESLIPSTVLNWGNHSWKKYFYMYIAESNKYIVYPRVALSTNMSEIGTHNKSLSTTFQAVLMFDFKRYYIFKELKYSQCIYDCFHESEKLSSYLKLDGQLCVDYYGIKNTFSNARYLISTRNLNYKIINQWSLALKPYELNIIYDIRGNDIYLYDLSEVKSNNMDSNSFNIITYELPGITRKKALIVFVEEFKKAIKRKLKKIIFKKC